MFVFSEGRCEVTLTLDLKEGTLKFTHNGRALGTIAGVQGPLHAAVTLTNSKQTVRAGAMHTKQGRAATHADLLKDPSTAFTRYCTQA